MVGQGVGLGARSSPSHSRIPNPSHGQKDLVFLFIQSLSHVFQKHLTLNITDEQGTLQTTNRWGETVFQYLQYLRMVFERQQKTRTLIIAALNPMEIRDAMPHARERLDNPKTTTTKYYIERFHNLLEEGKQTEARKQANARFDVLLGRLREHGLVEVTHLALGPVFFSKPEAVASEGQDPPPPPPGEAARPNLQVVAYQLCVFLY